jgi:hypothetical protein
MASLAQRADLSGLLDEGWRLYCSAGEGDALSRIVDSPSADSCKGSIEAIHITEQLIRLPT